MPSNGPRFLVPPAANMNQAAPSKASLALSLIDQALDNAYGRFLKSVEQEIQIYKAYRKQCDELLSRRTNVIEDLSASDTRNPASLNTRTDFDLPGILWCHDGVLCSLKPASKLIASPQPTPASDDCPSEPRSSTNSPSSNAPTDPPNPRQSEAARTVRQSSISDHRQQPVRVLRPKRSAAIADLDVLNRPTPPSKRLNSSQQQQQELQLQTIKTDVVTKEHYWIFDYADHTALYTLRCPSSTCNNPVFSKHPLRQERAERHFESCGVKFMNTDDLVRRFARQVVSGRKGREVKRAWARGHNSRLLAGDELHLACENLE